LWNSENEDITNFHGLGKPISRYSNGVFVVYGWYTDFRGIFCKNGLFNQTIQAGYIALVIVAVVN
jgi:NADH-quinone oxidoreductase subunit N